MTISVYSWSHLDVPHEDQLAFLTFMDWGVPLALSAPDRLDRGFFEELSTEVQLQAFAQDGPSHRTLISRLKTSDTAFNRRKAAAIQNWSAPDVDAARMARILLHALDPLESAPDWSWSLTHLTRLVNSCGELCREEDVLKALQTVLPGLEPDTAAIRSPWLDDGLAKRFPAARHGRLFRDMAYGGWGYLSTWHPDRRDDGLPRFRIRHQYAGMPRDMIPGVSRNVAQRTLNALMAARKDPAQLTEAQRRRLVMVTFLCLQGEESEDEPSLSEDLLRPIVDEGVFRGCASALSRAGSTSTNLWVYRLLLAWTLRQELGLEVKEAGTRTNVSSRTILQWLDGPAALLGQVRRAESFEEALENLLKQKERRTPPRDEAEYAVGYLVRSFLFGLPIERRFQSVRRIAGHLRVKHGQELSEVSLKRLLDRMSGRGELEVAWLEGESRYAARSNLTTRLAREHEEILSQIKEMYRWGVRCMALEGNNERYVRIDRKVVMVDRDEVDAVFTQVRNEMVGAMEQTVKPLPDDLPLSYRGSLLLSYRDPWTQEGQPLPLSYYDARVRKQ